MTTWPEESKSGGNNVAVYRYWSNQKLIQWTLSIVGFNTICFMLSVNFHKLLVPEAWPLQQYLQIFLHAEWKLCNRWKFRMGIYLGQSRYEVWGYVKYVRKLGGITTVFNTYFKLFYTIILWTSCYFHELTFKTKLVFEKCGKVKPTSWRGWVLIQSKIDTVIGEKSWYLRALRETCLGGRHL